MNQMIRYDATEVINTASENSVKRMPRPQFSIPCACRTQLVYWNRVYQIVGRYDLRAYAEY